MSWQPVSYWALRCDGDVPNGQCGELLYSDSYSAVSALAWNKHAEVVHAPTLFTSGCTQRDLLERWLSAQGWLKTDSRVLCPDHVQALEKQAEAAVDGLPFDEGAHQ